MLVNLDFYLVFKAIYCRLIFESVGYLFPSFLEYDDFPPLNGSLNAGPISWWEQDMSNNGVGIGDT